MPIIEYISERDHAEWDEFVLNSAAGNFFHLLGWKTAVEDSFGHKPHYLLARDNGELKGVLPLFELKSRLFGHSLVSVPFGVYGGVCAEDQAVRGALEDSAVTLAESMGVDYLELRNYIRPEGQEIPADDGWKHKDLYVTFQREILPTADENLKAIPRKQRAMVRKGIKAGLTPRVGKLDELDVFYAIYARNVRDLGTPVFPKSFFANIMKAFPDAFILTVLKEDVPVAGVLSFVYKDMLMPFYGAGVREYFRDAVNDYMYWALMEYGCDNGFKIFDFGRSKKDTGSYKFKHHWGFEAQDLDYRIRLIKAGAMPEVNPTNPKYRLFIEGWKKLPVPVANLVGPHIVRNIP